MNDRELLLDAFLAGIAAVDPDRATAAAAPMALEAFGGRPGRILAIAAGKGALAMARGLASVFPIDGGVAVAPDDGPSPIPVVIGGHPVPDEGSVVGARRALEIAESAGPGDTVVCLISGGASALLAAPAGDLTLADLQATNRILLTSGADIGAANTVRKHLSAIKGGRLARAARNARLVTLVLSDVVGDRTDVIASGPTVADPTTYTDALAVIDEYGMRERLPPRVIAHLNKGRDGAIAETPTRAHPRSLLRIVGSGPVAAQAAAAFLRDAGVAARVDDTPLGGEARDTARRVVAAETDGTVLVLSGETTVTVTGRGVGGRNQEAALAAAMAIAGRPVTFLAGGTDGADGPTDAAGGLVDGGTIARGAARGLDAAAFLADNDSHTYLAATGDLVVTGPTGTNVADLWLVKSSDGA